MFYTPCSNSHLKENPNSTLLLTQHPQYKLILHSIIGRYKADFKQQRLFINSILEQTYSRSSWNFTPVAYELKELQ